MEWTQCIEAEVATLRCIPIIIQNIITAALIFSGAVAVILVIYSGIKFISSRGNPEEVDSAKKILTYAIVGLLFILFSFFIIRLIAFVTGVDQLTNPTF